ncbi:uncharacterized protein EI97DRAFT_431018 [Westerdykella ornata]|uniref:BTB domain-containing protein n=1 Tax=Westerdykella ornata TaxID=318751 RepID=A0A6A6JQ72_WESOR|nr:uncharacterized protein EI97DRAFT_431018 [Westerdykella ornata]KAF2278771.1 hypothetical protein EI97DRAFT_431018 [Westerdykella ornata]
MAAAIMTGAPLFDSTECGLSDITICVTDGEEAKTYHAHKAILANRSQWFYKRISGDAGLSTVKLKESNLLHFDLLMKYFYHHPGRHRANINLDWLVETISVYCMAEKYESESVKEETIARFASATSKFLFADTKDKAKIVEAYYSRHSGSDAGMGRAIAG